MGNAQEMTDETVLTDTVFFPITEQYNAALQFLVDQRETANQQAHDSNVIPDAYLFQVLSTPTLYSAPLHQIISEEDSLSADMHVQRVQMVNQALARLYVENPSMVEQTETTLKEQGKIREDIAEKIHTEDQLATRVAAASLKPEGVDSVEVKTRRPNFWKFPGSTALNFTQYAYSHNWPGGENKYSGLTTIILNANYNDERKFTWTNNLDFRLGFQTSKTDKNRTFRPTNNQVVYTTNAGLKAYKTLSYTITVRMSTKIVPNYSPNTDQVYEDCLSPLVVTIGPGMTYSYKLGKKKPITGALSVAPLAYNIRYVQRASLVTRYGVRPGHHSSHAFGPTATLTYAWTIMPQVRWTGRFYWFSNLHKTQFDWTNTFNFTINKYFNATLNIHPTFDDNVKTNKGVRVEENLGLGMSYSF